MLKRAFYPGLKLRASYFFPPSRAFLIYSSFNSLVMRPRTASLGDIPPYRTP